MKLFKKFVFPGFYGLLVYFSIRLLHDTDIGLKFWTRSLATNLIEMVVTTVAGYLAIGIFTRLLRYFDSHWEFQLNYRTILKELFTLIFANAILVNILFLPVSSLTDDGLSWDDVVFMNVIPAFYTTMYYGIVRTRMFFRAYAEERLKFEKIKITQLETELKFLKAQYHPHFLFNALNTIYFQMDKDMRGAKLSIERFSGLLRYQLYDQQVLVPMSQEIVYLQSFVEFQRIRSSRKLQLKISIDPDLAGQLVYPLLFLPLVENAFKYVGGNYELSIKLTNQQNYIGFRVENSLPKLVHIKNDATGIGLENLKRRLDLLYPERHELYIHNNDNQLFIADLKIQYE